MPQSRPSSTALALAAFVGLATGVASAQDAPLMTAERSRTIQATLADVDKHRAGFVHELFLAWTPYVDANAFDLWDELQGVALRAPAWQLYGASLVGDFETMVRILRGEEGPGAYINALAEAEPKAVHDPAWTRVDINAFPTGTTDNLVYVPIAPCRVVDTRGVGARTGIIPNNGTRSFDLEDDAFTSGQGGVAACAGLPGFSHYGWAVNVTVVGYSAVGGLKAWGFNAPEPNASIINYAPGSFALANGLILTGCYGCVDDITIRAFGSATHVIIDVMGYFRQAETATAVVTRLAGATVGVAAGGFTFVQGGACPGGTQLIGGELDFLSGGNVMVGEMARMTAATMRFWAVNQDGATNNAVAYSVCQDSPLKAAP